MKTPRLSYKVARSLRRKTKRTCVFKRFTLVFLLIKIDLILLLVVQELYCLSLLTQKHKKGWQALVPLHVYFSDSAYPEDTRCSFDKGSLCGWSQSTEDTFDWIVNSGMTGSSGTGPNGDHTTGSGEYIYLESSSPRKMGDLAQLLSPSLPANQTKCLTFFYSMYGDGSGRLSVSLEVGIL